MAVKMNKAIFLDKDGTLIKDIPYNVDPAKISFEKGVIEGMSELNKYGYLFIVVTNQSGVARGYFSEEDLVPVYKEINQQLLDFSLTISGFYHCPHLLGSSIPGYNIDCNCRKPNSGLLQKAAEDFSINLSASWMVGDILNDVEAGKKVGCQTAFIDNGHETEWQITPRRYPDVIAIDFKAAVNQILNINNKEPYYGFIS